MTAKPIAFLDSGIGGLPYLAAARGMLPGRRCLYVADRENFPYGEKPREGIIAAVESAVRKLLAREDPELVVVACNTASVVALEALRDRFPLPFVGVVPAIKPAAAASAGGRFGVLATQQTVEGEYLRGLIARFAAGCAVVSLPAADLVRFVEEDLLDSTRDQRLDRVALEVQRFHVERIDTLVLACTHFLHLEEEFRELLEARGIRVIDSRDGVSRQIARLCGEGGGDRVRTPEGEARGGPDGALYVTGEAPIEERYRLFGQRFGLCFAGRLA